MLCCRHGLHESLLKLFGHWLQCPLASSQHHLMRKEQPPDQQCRGQGDINSNEQDHFWIREPIQVPRKPCGTQQECLPEHNADTGPEKTPQGTQPTRAVWM